MHDLYVELLPNGFDQAQVLATELLCGVHDGLHRLFDIRRDMFRPRHKETVDELGSAVQ